MSTELLQINTLLRQGDCDWSGNTGSLAEYWIEASFSVNRLDVIKMPVEYPGISSLQSRCQQI